jgi:outer membrane protein OmpA-like peptidoglycan-associated protein
VVATASLSGFASGSSSDDLESGEKLELDIELKPLKKETAANIGDELEKGGRAVLYGIHFDSNSAVPLPESEATLRQLLALLREKPDLGLIVEGHTDSQNTEEFNQKLSENRAEAVETVAGKKWTGSRTAPHAGGVRACRRRASRT